MRPCLAFLKNSRHHQTCSITIKSCSITKLTQPTKTDQKFTEYTRLLLFGEVKKKYTLQAELGWFFS
jgi:hypothetical protein